MIRINALLIMLLFFVSCNTNKSVIQTTRKKGPTSSTSWAKTDRKPIVKETSQESKSTAKQDQNSVVIEATARVKVTNELVLAYIENYKGVAQSNMKKYGIPASIILGQAILESGAGTAPLSVQANNHFGIKCHKDWMGESVKYDDDSLAECFRKYNNASDSFRDHALFLTMRSRYSQLFKLDRTDYKSWAKGLKEAGYATDVQYPTKLIGLIERFQLYKYDVEVPGSDVTTDYSKEQVVINPKEYRVVQGDTLYSISKKFKISVTELKNKNNISDNTISIGQSLKIE